MAKPETDLGGEVLGFDLPNNVSSAFDVEAFNEAVRAHGVRFVHFRGMKSPLGMIDRFDTQRPDPSDGGSNGYVYTRAGCFSALLTSNSKALRASEAGGLNAATAQLTPTQHYDCGAPVYLDVLDRLYLEEESILVTASQLVEAHETGIDRLRFPAAQVFDVIDATGVRYSPGDYSVGPDGSIVWGARRPGANPEAGRGRVYAIRFGYRPFWYVEQLLHEIRVAQYEDPFTGERRTVQMPQSARVQREYVFHAEARVTDGPGTERQMPGPSDGGFGAR